MGRAKELMLEEMAREYYTSDDAVCAKCFLDSGIQAFIRKNLSSNTCSVCGRSSQKLIAAKADKLLQFFLDKVHEHFQDADGNAPPNAEDGGYYVATWNMHELLSDEFEDIAEYETIEWLSSRLKDDIVYCKQDWQVMSLGEALNSAWEEFCRAVKHQTRFLFFPKTSQEDEYGEPFRVPPGEMLEELGNVVRQCGLIREVAAGTKMFRVRGHKRGQGFTTPVEIGPPPEKLAKGPGRMNAPGIVVMYAAFDRETALAEATGEHSSFSIGIFETLSNIVVVDLTEVPRIPSIFERGPREYIQFLHSFVADVSQPFTPDTEIHIEYTPTQVVSEYLRHRLRSSDDRPIGGLLYRSAKKHRGVNLALFVESEEVEGGASKSWKPKEPILRLLGIEEKYLPRRRNKKLARSALHTTT